MGKYNCEAVYIYGDYSTAISQLLYFNFLAKYRKSASWTKSTLKYNAIRDYPLNQIKIQPTDPQMKSIMTI